MNPEIDTTPGLGLPQPSAEIGQASLGYAPERSRGPEVSAPRFETMPPLSPTQTSQPLPAVGQSQSMPTPLVAMPVQDDATQDDGADTSALDAEWVNKAKEIVERTHTDPYLQSKELSRIKAQYIKARYSKDIKVSEET
jgi:hypothetical protein